MAFDFDAFTKFISFVGIPGAFMIGVLIMMWKAGCWLGPRLEAMVARHVAFLDTVQANVETMTDVLKELQSRPSHFCNYDRHLKDMM